ncbi:glycoside hydrolase family 55 protein [Athelia psychrophila]|uniref:Glycoside hydrolase family 55 protein n=1 Tax=Athelia psychrophila TaxID=1759441 RepID=A0A166RLL3_9AGAM|nr:glycoside hydrolase family 55 protein [Fibularhizoctonia sp. CBS 109695]
MMLVKVRYITVRAYREDGGTGETINPKFAKKNKTGNIANPTNAASLLDSSGHIFPPRAPAGNGKTNDTAALQAVFDAYAGYKIIFFDARTYIVSSTLKTPVGTQMTGEVWSVIMCSGSAFSDMTKLIVVVQAGAPGDSSMLEISDIIFATVGLKQLPTISANTHP